MIYDLWKLISARKRKNNRKGEKWSKYINNDVSPKSEYLANIVTYRNFRTMSRAFFDPVPYITVRLIYGFLQLTATRGPPKSNRLQSTNFNSTGSMTGPRSTVKAAKSNFRSSLRVDPDSVEECQNIHDHQRVLKGRTAAWWRGGRRHRLSWGPSEAVRFRQWRRGVRWFWERQRRREESGWGSHPESVRFRHWRWVQICNLLINGSFLKQPSLSRQSPLCTNSYIW